MKSAVNDSLNPPLPSDLAQCHALIAQLLAVQEELTATVRLQEREKALLLERVQQLLRKQYGRSSERGRSAAVAAVRGRGDAEGAGGNA